jgi:type IV secretion system protein VirB2
MLESIPDPEGSSAIVAALQWLEGTLLGSVATSIAVVAIASVGYGMLTGRIDWRRGATTILGCFVVFGASTIVSGIESSAVGAYEDAPISFPASTAIGVQTPPLVVQPPPLQSIPSVPATDPFAGASVPSR